MFTRRNSAFSRFVSCSIVKTDDTKRETARSSKQEAKERIMAVDYELAKETDIRELYALQLLSFESEAEMIGSRNVPALMETYEHHRKDFRNWIVLIKRDKTGRIIGSVRFKKVDDHIEIGRLMVSPENRNQGIAIDLMHAVEQVAQEKTLELYTCTKSYINIKLYEKLGYRTYKEERGSEDLSFVYMRKII